MNVDYATYAHDIIAIASLLSILLRIPPLFFSFFWIIISKTKFSFVGNLQANLTI